MKNNKRAYKLSPAALAQRRAASKIAGEKRRKGPRKSVSLRAADDQPQSPRVWTKAELRDIEDGIVQASRRYDAEFVAAVEKKAGGL